MLFDPSILVRQPAAVVAVLLVILIGKSIAAFLIVMGLGYPVGTAVTASAALAQIGEFSFILAGLGITLGLLPPEGRDLILAGAILSITLNPLVFASVPAVSARLSRLFAGGEPRRTARLDTLAARLQPARHPGEPAVSLGLQPGALMSKFPMFADLDDSQRAELLTLFKPSSAAPGDRVIRAGDEGNEMYFISSGAVEVSIHGRRIPLGPGDVFGEMALITGERRTADVTAIDYCLFLTLSKADFESFIARHPELRARLSDIAAKRAAMNLETSQGE
jgi:CPA2 family monovalent cation:H+ antiporter-2